MSKKPDPVDIIVGKNIRFFRTAKGMSQSDLGKELGVTFQQVQKYENGHNRVGSSRLARVSKVLDVPVARLFTGAATDGRGNADARVTELLLKPHALRMLKALAGLPDDKTRLAFIALMEDVAEAER